MEVKYANNFVPAHEHNIDNCNFYWNSIFDFLSLKRMKSMEEKIDNLEKLIRSQNDSSN